MSPSPSYRILHFAPDPFSGYRVPMAAIVRLASGDVRVARAHALPTSCLPAGRARVLGRMVSHLDAIDNDDTLPAVFGPYAVLGDPVAIPKGVADAFSWVESLLNPANPTARPGTQRNPNRATLGYQFFETYQVSKHVHRSFVPGHDLGLFTAIPGLKTVSHWAGTPTHLLLMEPVVPKRPKFEKDLAEIASTFMNYRWAMEHNRVAGDVRLVTYVTSSEDRDRVSIAREQLGIVSDVIDTSSKRERDAFIQNIRAAAAAPEFNLDT